MSFAFRIGLKHGCHQQSAFQPRRVYPNINTIHRLGPTFLSAFTLTFQTHLFSILPPSFSRGFKALIVATLPPNSTAPPPPNRHLWNSFESLGLLDRFDSIIASVGYEHIEAYVLATCTGDWSKPMMETLRAWMSDKMVSWMLLPYARGASNGKWLTCIFAGPTQLVSR